MQQAATVTVVQLQYGSAVELQGLPVTPRTAFGDDECDPCLLLQLLLGVATPTNDERHQLHAGRGGGTSWVGGVLMHHAILSQVDPCKCCITQRQQ